MDDVYDELKRRAAAVLSDRGLLGETEKVKARALSPEEAIGNLEADDFPIQKGRERLMQADVRGSFGQAFTDLFGDYEGMLESILEAPLTNNYRRAIFVAAINAALRHLGLVEGTVHCRDKGPKECADALADHIQSAYGRPRVAQIGFQPRMAEALSSRFETRVLDMDRDNIGKRKCGALIEPPEAAESAVAWADLLVVTGTTLVNGTIHNFLTEKPAIFYGTTVAGAAHLMGWSRFCARST